MDRLKAMALLVKVAETGSLTAAAREMKAPLPSVSRRIGELEAYLGARLLARTTRRLALTESGAAYVAASRRILEQVEQAERAVAGEADSPRGELVVAAPIVFGRLHMTPVIAGFLARFEEVSVKLTLNDRNANLVGDQIDVALRIGALADSALTARRVGEVRRIVCASPDYLASHGAPEQPEDLERHACIAFEALEDRALWTFGDRAVRPYVRLSVNTAEAALEAAAAGAGIARAFSYQAARGLARGGLVRLLPTFEPAPVPVQLLFDGRGPMPSKLRAFLDFAAPRLAARLAP